MMNEMKSGFTLIEIMIATLIASVLSISLFYSYSQTNRMVGFIDDYVEIFDAAILIDQRFSKDVSGAFIPVQAIRQKKDDKAKKEPDKKKVDAKQPDVKKSEKEQNKAPVLKDPFISKNFENNLTMFSFITNNPVRSFWGKQSGGPKTNVARIVYTLEADKTAPKDKPKFTLYRQEGQDLNLSSYTNKESQVERYAVAENVKACKILFIATDEHDKTTEVKEFTDWVTSKDEKDFRSKIKLPETVVLTISLWNTDQTRDKEFVLVVPVAAPFSELPPQEPLKQASPPSTGSKSASSERKEMLVSSANRVVDSIRGLYRT